MSPDDHATTPSMSQLPKAPACPWCPATAATMKQLLHHMQSRHPRQWEDMDFYPPIAGGVW